MRLGRQLGVDVRQQGLAVFQLAQRQAGGQLDLADAEVGRVRIACRLAAARTPGPESRPSARAA